METKLNEIKQLVDKAIKDGWSEEDDSKRAIIYGKCLSNIKILINDTNKNN